MAYVRGARDGASDRLAKAGPPPDGVELRRLRKLAMGGVREAERLEAANGGDVAGSVELVSAALDVVMRDYFKRAMLCAASRRVR
jgi:hypothetical protein